MMLRSVSAPWHDPEIPTLLRQPPNTLSQDQLIVLVEELDRRFMQLWDKVAFERDNQLIDYTKLKDAHPCHML